MASQDFKTALQVTHINRIKRRIADAWTLRKIAAARAEAQQNADPPDCQCIACQIKRGSMRFVRIEPGELLEDAIARAGAADTKPSTH